MGLEMLHVLLLLLHSSRILSRRTLRLSGHHALSSVEAQRAVERDAAQLKR